MAAFSTPDITASLMHVQAQQQGATKTSLVSEADKTKLSEKAKEFESFFIFQMMELMKTETDSEFDGGYAEETFRHTLNEQMAGSITQAGGFGIADTVYTQLLKQQEQLVSARMAAKEAYAGAAQ